MAVFSSKYLDHPLTVEDLTIDSWTEIFQSHFQSNDLKVLDAQPYQVGGSGGSDSVNSDMTGVIVQLTRTGIADDVEDVYTVIKSPGSVKFARLLSKVQQPCFCECLWYGVFAQEIAKRSAEVQKSIPTCYHCNCSYFDVEVPIRCERCCCFPFYIPFKKAEEGIIILENVCTSPKKYRLYDKHKVIDFKHCSMALTALGHFHGGWSQLIKDMRDPLVRSKEKALCSFKTLSQMFRVKVPLIFVKFMINSVQSTVVKLLRNQNEDPALIRRLERFIKHDAMTVLRLVYDMRNNSTVATMCHGDFWSNNMMFSYKDEDDASVDPQSVVLLDFQMLAVGHPLLDFLYFLFIGTDTEFRRQHAYDLLEIYYNVYTSYWDDETRLRYTYSDFKNDYDECKVYGYLIGSMIIPNMLSSQPMDREMSFSDHKQKLEREILGTTPELRDCPKLCEVRRRIVGMVHEFDEEGYFSCRKKPLTGKTSRRDAGEQYSQIE